MGNQVPKKTAQESQGGQAQKTKSAPVVSE